MKNSEGKGQGKKPQDKKKGRRPRRKPTKKGDVNFVAKGGELRKRRLQKNPGAALKSFEKKKRKGREIDHMFGNYSEKKQKRGKRETCKSRGGKPPVGPFRKRGTFKLQPGTSEP